jgi:hypothetical protein
LEDAPNLNGMNASYIESNNIELLDHSLLKLSLDDDTLSVLFLMAYEERYPENLLIPLLQKHDKSIIGGVFPELIFMGERKSKGVLLLPLPFDLNTQLFDLSQTPEDFLEQLESAQKNSLDLSSTLFVFMDAMSNHKEFFIESLFNFFGVNSAYIGGGAGSLKFETFPCIITNSGIYTNAAVIGWANRKTALGVAHGWQPVSAPLKVTKTVKNTLVSINWRPAFMVYKEIVEKHSGMRFTADNFFQIAKSYPLGITKIDAEVVVRDPFKVTGDILHVVDVINEGAYITILNGNMVSLLAGASKAKEIAFSKADDTMDKENVFCIDCISRVLYMQNDFKKELEIIGNKVTVTGVLTIGEIANSEESFLEIYNKTIVLGIW